MIATSYHRAPLHSRPARQTRPARVGIPAAIALACALMIGLALAYWSVTSAPGGNGASGAVSVNHGETPTATAEANAVTITWDASTLSNGDPVDGYLVKRYDAATETSQTMLSACTGTVTATTCVETGVPTGSWVYSVTPVVGTNWRGAESAMSNTVTTDPSPPANDISLSVVTGDAVTSGTTVYYRGTAAGSFILTNAVTDAGSGPASSATAALGGTTTGWTHTASTVSTPAGGPYVSNAFSWVAGTTSSPTEVVTGRDVAGNTVTTTLTFINDSTAPTAGTISYTDGYQPGRSVPVTFTTGTDAGSGIGTRQLQRQSAPLTAANTCVTWSGYTDIGQSDPTSIFTDNLVANRTCYQYRYVVTDHVGNTHTATSGNVSKVDYAGAVAGTSGALSHWRLGESGPATIATHTFTGTNGTLLTSTGTGWTYWYGGDNEQIRNNRITSTDAGRAIYTASAVPSSPNYSVEADIHYLATLANDMTGVIGRFSNTGTTPTFYMARYELSDQSWNLVKYSGTTVSYLNYVTNQAFSVGQTKRVRLEMTGTNPTYLRLYVDGVLTVSAADANSPYQAAGVAGFMEGNNGSSVVKSISAGLHLDNFSVANINRAADSAGTNTADYVNGPTRGAAGALVGDADTAASFDGTNDYVQALGTTGLPTGAGVRSIEMWFKTSSSSRQVLFNYGSLAAAQEYALWIDAGGTTMTAWGFGSGNDKVFTMPAAVNDGEWHHVVQTYDGGSLRLYIDGVALPAQAATRNTVMNAYGFNIGAVVTPGDFNSGGYFNGSLDEVSFYTSVLTQTNVSNHYELGASAADVTGPTGGSIDASGLVGTGARYAASTTLSLNLAKGTDPSGVSPTGAQVRRATATLTSAGGTADGVCGTYGSYTLITGGTDPTSPVADTVAGQACYRYRYLVPDTLGNYTIYTSGDIKVDLGAPAAPALSFGSFTNTYWSSGTTVYYRSTASSGSFTATATATDAASGIASYTFPALGSNWTSTPGSLGVNTYSWSGSPAAPGTKSVTATNNATIVSLGASFVLNADNTAPTPGTVTYANGTQATTTVTVSFTTGTENGSGLGTRLLQRASATLNGSTCGTYGSFATITNGTNPTSPVVDTVTTGMCHTYQYVVADRVGNQHVASSASVVKVTQSYFDRVDGTAGLLSYWRLGEPSTALGSADSFSGTAGTLLTSRAGEVGATWIYQAGSANTERLSNEGRARRNGTGFARYYTTAVPASADYSVEADLFVKSYVAGDRVAVIGRLDTGTGSFYAARWEPEDTSWNIMEFTGGTGAYLQYVANQGPLVAGQTYRLRLTMTGTTLQLYVNGELKVTATDGTLTAAGRAGIYDGNPNGTMSKSDSAGIHFDNFQVTPSTYPRAADSKGTNTGDYFNGVTLGATGTLPGDTNTAAQFDGLNDNVVVAREISTDFSIEFWFKSTQVFGTTCTHWWQGARLVDAEVAGPNDDFGTALCGGRIIAGVGGTADVSIVSGTGYNDGNWHHVVFTRTQSTGAMQLYIDGNTPLTATAHNRALTASTVMTFGRSSTPGHYFAGTLDEIGVYNTVLSGETVTAHFTGAAAASTAPVLTTTGTSLAYTENATTPVDPGITITDTSNVTSATVTMTTGYVNGQDTLAVATQNGITGSWSASTGVLTLTGTATVANYQTALRSVTYTNGSDAPSTATRTVAFTAANGALTSNTATRTITLTAVNDGPVNTVPAAQSTTMNTANVFSTGNGNLISISDADAASSSMQVQLVATNGTTTLSGTTGLSFTAGDGTADATMTFTGTITNINAALAGLSFNPTAAFSGAATLQIVTSDLGNTGTGGALTDDDTVTITVGALGIFTSQQDIGGPSIAGSSSHTSGTYTVAGSGADIWGTADQFQYLSMPMTGDGRLTARVVSQTNTHAFAKAAVMFRQTLAANSIHTMANITPTSGVQHILRPTTGAVSTSTTAAGFAAPYWLRLTRVGDTYRAERSPDGTTWTQVGTTQTITMGSTIYAGLAVTSHTNAAISTVVFDNVTLTTPPTAVEDSYSVVQDTTLTVPAPGVLANDTDPESDPLTAVLVSGTTGLTLNANGSFEYVPPANFSGSASFTYKANDGVFDSNTVTVTITVTPSSLGIFTANQDIGGPTIAGSSSYSAGTYTVAGSGADIWGTTDQFQYLSIPMTGDGRLTARVASQTNTHASAKAGVMMRSTLATGSVHTMMNVMPTNGAEQLYRTTTNGATTASGQTGLAAPYWVRLTRAGDTYTAERSPDGVTWTQQGTTQTITMGSTIYVGLAVTSHNNAALNTATFDNVTLTGSTSGTYAESVLVTSGLLNFYRMGDTSLSSDTFTGTTGATVQSRNGEVGATWTRHAASSGDLVLTDAGRLRKNGATGGSLNYTSAVPSNADYTVEVDIHVKSFETNDGAGVVARLDPASALGTYYLLRREGGEFGQWSLYSVVNNSWAWITSYSQQVVVNSTYHLELQMVGSTITVRIDGVQRIQVLNNTAITAAGRGGILSGFPASGTSTVTNTTGLHFDNFRISPPRVLDSGTALNHGTFFGGVTLGATGALNGDTNTAATFDGVDDYAAVARQISGNFTIEFWFKSTQGLGTDTRWSQGAGMVDNNISGTASDFGISLRSDGCVVAGVGGGTDTSVVSSTCGYADGNWHHVAMTRTQSSGVFTLYVDGLSRGTATNNTSALTAQANLNFGRLASGTNYYAGSLDEIAIYDVALSGATIAAHFAAR